MAQDSLFWDAGRAAAPGPLFGRGLDAVTSSGPFNRSRLWLSPGAGEGLGRGGALALELRQSPCRSAPGSVLVGAVAGQLLHFSLDI